MHTPPARPLPLGKPPPLVTKRLKLRTLGADDAKAIATLADDWDIARNLGRLPHPYGLDDADFYLREIVPRELAWAITARTDGVLMGVAGLVPDPAAGPAELGYWLGRAYWGQGFATEACAAIVAYGLAEPGLTAITSGCFVDNEASYRVLTKMGFVEAGRSQRSCLARNVDFPCIEMHLAAARSL